MRAVVFVCAIVVALLVSSVHSSTTDEMTKIADVVSSSPIELLETEAQVAESKSGNALKKFESKLDALPDAAAKGGKKAKIEKAIKKQAAKAGLPKPSKKVLKKLEKKPSVIKSLKKANSGKKDKKLLQKLAAKGAKNVKKVAKAEKKIEKKLAKKLTKKAAPKKGKAKSKTKKELKSLSAGANNLAKQVLKNAAKKAQKILKAAGKAKCPKCAKLKKPLTPEQIKKLHDKYLDVTPPPPAFDDATLKDLGVKESFSVDPRDLHHGKWLNIALKDAHIEFLRTHAVNCALPVCNTNSNALVHARVLA